MNCTLYLSNGQNIDLEITADDDCCEVETPVDYSGIACDMIPEVDEVILDEDKLWDMYQAEANRLENYIKGYV